MSIQSAFSARQGYRPCPRFPMALTVKPTAPLCKDQNFWFSRFPQNDNLPTQLQFIHSPHVVSIKLLAKNQPKRCTTPCRHQTPSSSSTALIWVATHTFVSSIPLPHIRLSSRIFVEKVFWCAVDLTGKMNAGILVLPQIRKDFLPLISLVKSWLIEAF